MGTHYQLTHFSGKIDRNYRLLSQHLWLNLSDNEKIVINWQGPNALGLM